MIERRPLSGLARLALLTLQRIHAAELEELAQEAAASDQALASDGWRFGVTTMEWIREVPDPLAQVPVDE